MPAEEPLRDNRAFHLIETMRWEPGFGIVRCALHMQRLAASAHMLGFALNMDRVVGALSRLEGARNPLRVRLTLDRSGAVDVRSQPFVALPNGTVWRLGIGSVRLESGDTLLRHKTSLRSRYDQARAEFDTSEVDEVLLLNEHGQLCEGTITNLFVKADDGPLVTPPISCGLLAGVLRAELLAQGKAIERVVRPEDLTDGAVFVGNSLRGLIPGRLS